MVKNDNFGKALEKQKAKESRRIAKELHEIARYEKDSYARDENNLTPYVVENSQIKELIHKKEIYHEKFAITRGENPFGTNFESNPNDDIDSETDIFDRNNLKNDSGYIFIRPDFNLFSDAKAFQNAEQESFTAFKRKLYEKSIANQKSLTPFEKNLQIWLQMWRVIEKSDLIVQIVDSRNPEFYYCYELTQLIEKNNPHKRNLLLINKSDLIREHQYEILKKYYESKNIQIVFYSSLNNHEKTFCLKSDQLISKFEEYMDILQLQKISVGFIGFPNVGKSSLINNLIGEKRVAISSTPGKTKHLQSLILSDDIVLYDSPGLVFPKFVEHKDYLILNGITPIDQTGNISSSIQYLVKYIPIKHFERCYMLKIPSKSPEYCTSEELLTSLAIYKGFVSHKSVPDMSKAAKLILKDLFSGKLLLCYPPSESIDLFSYNEFNKPYENIKVNVHIENQIKSVYEKSDEDKLKEINEQTIIRLQQQKNIENDMSHVSIHKLRKGPKNPRKQKLRRLYPD